MTFETIMNEAHRKGYAVFFDAILWDSGHSFSFGFHPTSDTGMGTEGTSYCEHSVYANTYADVIREGWAWVQAAPEVSRAG